MTLQVTGQLHGLLRWPRRVKKMKHKLIIGCIMALLIAQMVSAFGITTLFYDRNPLITTPGKVEEVQLLLQNTDERKDVRLKARIIEGADIAEITDESLEYFVPMGEKNVKVNLRIRVPDTMKPEERRDIKVSFTQVGIDKEGEMVQLGTGITAVTPLVIASPPAPVAAPGNSMLVVAVVLLALAAAIGVLMFRRKKAKKLR